MTPALNANCPIAQHNGESMSADLGTWLLDHQFVLLSLIAALGGVGRLLLRWKARRDAQYLRRIEKAALGSTDRD